MVSQMSFRSHLIPLPSSFIGLMDLKMGQSCQGDRGILRASTTSADLVTPAGGNLISYFGMLNKVAGVYGMLAVVHTGDLAQVALYVYSLGTLALLAWGIRNINKVAILSSTAVYLAPS